MSFLKQPPYYHPCSTGPAPRHIAFVLIITAAFVGIAGAGFVDRTAHHGLTLDSSPATWADIDGDGFVDLNCGGTLWQNIGGEQFVYAGTIVGGVFGDFDNDGDLDLFTTGNRTLYRNNGDFSFVEHPFPELPMAWCRGASWADYDKDGYLDLYVSGYEETGVQYWPDVIVRNNTDSTFSVVWTQPPTELAPGRGVTSCDFNEDGHIDIYVSNYRLEANRLWLNNGSGSFTDVAADYGVAGAAPFWGYAHTIGSAWGDLDNDGHFDLFVGNFAHPAGYFYPDDPRQPESQFLKNLGSDGSYHFQDMSSAAGLAYQESYASPALADYDNDGDLDLFLTTAPDYSDQAVLYRNDGNWQFADVTSTEGLAGITPSYQAAWADFDKDGDLDLVTGAKLFVNQGNSNHYLKVRLIGDPNSLVNLTAIGSQVRIDFDGYILTRQVEAGTSERNQNDMTLHFGLGGRTAPVNVEVRWPNGQTHTRANVLPDREITISYLPYPLTDLNLDQYVDFADFLIFSRHWLDCTDPNPPCNYVPEPLVSTLRFRNGLEGYAGCQDGHLKANQLERDYGGSSAFLVQGEGIGCYAQTLLKFDVSGVPAGQTIDNATLRVYFTSHLLTGWQRLIAYPMLVDTNIGTSDGDPAPAGIVDMHQRAQGQANWGQPISQDKGPQPGVGGVGADFDVNQSWTSQNHSYGNSGSGWTAGYGWVEMEVTSLVEQWYDGTLDDSQGIVLFGDASQQAAYYVSSDSTNPELRPELVVTYRRDLD